jgi:hypothetical protein
LAFGGEWRLAGIIQVGGGSRAGGPRNDLGKAADGGMAKIKKESAQWLSKRVKKLGVANG